MLDGQPGSLNIVGYYRGAAGRGRPVDNDIRNPHLEDFFHCNGGAAGENNGTVDFPGGHFALVWGVFGYIDGDVETIALGVDELRDMVDDGLVDVSELAKGVIASDDVNHLGGAHRKTFGNKIRPVIEFSGHFEYSKSNLFFDRKAVSEAVVEDAADGRFAHAGLFGYVAQTGGC